MRQLLRVEPRAVFKPQVLWPLSNSSPQPPTQFNSSFESDRQPHTQTRVYKSSSIMPSLVVREGGRTKLIQIKDYYIHGMSPQLVIDGCDGWYHKLKYYWFAQIYASTKISLGSDSAACPNLVYRYIIYGYIILCAIAISLKAMRITMKISRTLRQCFFWTFRLSS